MNLYAKVAEVVHHDPRPHELSRAIARRRTGASQSCGREIAVFAGIFRESSVWKGSTADVELGVRRHAR